MGLYRIILVDNGEKVRQSIIRKIDRTGAGFCVVGDAEDREEALEKVEALEPGLMLTDIKTPFMDSLSLAERAKQKYSSIKIVILSGYDDFEYARQAIKLGVMGYILRPVNVEELTAILECIKSNLDDEIEQKRNVSLLREDYIHNLPILGDRFLGELVENTAPGSVLKEKLAEYDIPLAGAKKWVTAVIDIELEETRERNMLSLRRERDLTPISVMQAVKEKLGDYCRSSVFTSSRTSWSEPVLIAAIDGDSSQTGSTDVLGDICKKTKKILEIPITAGTGHNCQDLGEVNCSYKTVVDTLGYKAIVGAGSTIYINGVEPVSGGKLSFGCKGEARFTAAIKFGPREKIEEAMQAVMDKMGDAKVHFRQYQAYMLSVSSSIVQPIQQYDLGLEQLTEEGEQQGDAFAVTPRMMKKEGFAHWLPSAVLRISQTISRERDNTMKQVTQEAKEYIMGNYQDTDLFVEKICHQLHMSPAYFSTMFKEETGQVYTAYLAQARLDKAVELLNKTDDKTYTITAKMGYQEQGYFSYVFKRRLGVPPTKFKGARQIQQTCAATYGEKRQAT